MPSKYDGTIVELKSFIDSANIIGTWSEDGNEKYTFRSKKGGVLHWWASNGTLQWQGQSTAKKELENAVMGLINSSVVSDRSTSNATKKVQQIFIVHGHDTEARDQLELALHRLGLQPFILMNASGGGKTIIEALEGKIGRDYSSDFGIVLFTPDDVGYPKKDGAARAEPRARQNVILETGMLLSSLTRNRIAIIVKGHIELPSDLQGIIHFGYNERIKEIVPKLCQRLKEAGFDLQPHQIAEASQ